ncbi:hypothetical protein CFSAN002064_20685 [Salmonella enterica subsp. enterica serovar Heidelberg str. CFSAN002064]|nr:hypothetical protein CFSAN002064_20685 [Salmonella enterica subsp. enterica serovar Heidelberg str. CFSAN002064]
MPDLLCTGMIDASVKTMSYIIGMIFSLRYMFSQGIAPWIEKEML